MYKGSFAAGGTAGTPPTQTPPSINGRNRPENRPAPRLVDPEEITPRPIIKEEELIRMDEIDKDMGWTCHDDIDYNQKLAFSDDESSTDKKSKRESKSSSIATASTITTQKEYEKSDSHPNESQSRNWNNKRSADEELWKQRRQHNKDIELTVQRAKQRKEEEEKRFNEATKQGAAKKLMELEEKMSKRNREEEGVGTINPSVVPPKPIVPADIPLPDFQREKERERDRDSRSRTPNDPAIDEKNANSFRQLTQIEGKNFTPRKHVKGSERERDVREQNGPSFSRHFQSQLPPRFQKQRNNSSSNLQGQMHFTHSFDNRWTQGGQGLSKTNLRHDSPDRDLDDDRRDYKRQSSEDSHRSSHRSQSELSHKFGEDSHDYRHQDYDYRKARDDDKWQKDGDKKKHDDDWHSDRRDKYREDKHERPQRPDSRDSRASRESRQSRDSARDSEPRDHIGSWADTVFEPTYEEKRRDHGREDRRQVPGPITKERIEADDMRNEKRGLTQLKRGQMPEKKISEKKDEKTQEGNESKAQEQSQDSGTKAWADAVSPNTIDPENPKYMDTFEKSKSSSSEVLKQENDLKKSDKSDSEFKDKDDKRGRNRSYGSGKGWSSGNEYHRSNWSKRQSGRGMRPGGPQRPGDFHGTDSEGSLDEVNADGSSQKSPKTVKKSEKDDKNKEIKQHDKPTTLERNKEKQESKRENYVPRGEPSRHGRGGGNFRGRGGLSKRIDGYGPPPSKSPFGHHDDKDKKLSSDENNSGEVGSNEDKAKQNQQALSAGIIGSTRKELGTKPEDKSKSRKPDTRRGKSKSKDGKRDDDNVDSNSDNSDDKDGKGLRKSHNKPRGPPCLNQPRRSNAPPRLTGEKKPYSSRDNPVSRQNSSGALRSQSAIKKDEKSTDPNSLCNAIADISLKNKPETEPEDGDEKVSLHGDSDGFQEVKSKKTGKERQKPSDEKPGKTVPKLDKDLNKDRKAKPISTTQLTQQQISNIPPLMATPVNPPPVLPQSNKNQFERPRQSKLAPRFAKQRENNRLQKAQMQQNICDVNDMNKVNQSMNVYGMKDASSVVPPLANAWDKSLGAQLRGIDSENVLGVSSDGCKTMDHVQATSQSNSPSNDKVR